MKNKLDVDWWSFIWGGLVFVALLHPNMVIGIIATISALLLFFLWWANQEYVNSQNSKVHELKEVKK